MYKYFDIDGKWRKGFITHKDRKDLHFIVIGKIAKVISDKENKIDKWAERIGVAEMAEDKAEADIKQHQLDGLTYEKTRLEASSVGVQSKIDILEVS